MHEFVRYRETREHYCSTIISFRIKHVVRFLGDGVSCKKIYPMSEIVASRFQEYFYVRFDKYSEFIA